VSATVAIIPARAGSKGIPGKNLVTICGTPLVGWSIRQALAAGVDSVWVSSDGDDILDTARRFGARAIRRPVSIAGDTASSESAWAHALDAIEADGIGIDLVIGMQATSPLREPADLVQAMRRFHEEQLDSLLSVVEIEDFFMWRIDPAAGPQSVNYDWRDRKRRQAIEKRYLENGSFYLFRPALLRASNNRLGGRIGVHVMQRHKMFQIDNPEDVALVEAIMRGYGLDRLGRD
jgi:CMP-N,N'-diacetyllegionaminic acid synthase